MIKLLLLACVLMAAPQDTVRVWSGPGGIRILHMAYPNCLGGESRDDCKERLATRLCLRKEDGSCRRHVEITSENFPSEDTDRDQWRVHSSSGAVTVDPTVVTRRSRIEAAEAAVDSELAKENPDPVKVIRFQRKLDKERAK